MDENLTFKIDSKPAQADLLSLAKALDVASAASVRMDKSFNTLAINTNANLTKAAKAMEKYAQVASLLSKIKVAGNPMGQVRELASALDAIGRARAITEQKVNNVRQLGAAMQALRVPPGLMGVSTLLNALGRARIPNATQIKNLEELFVVLGSYKGAPNVGNLEKFFVTVSTLRAPSKGTLDNLQRLFLTLGEAKEIPGATRIVLQLDAIAGAASRAAKALAGLPAGRSLSALTKGVGGVGAAAAGGATSSESGKLSKTLDEGSTRATKARASFSLLGGGLSDLTGRFRLAYQANTLLNAAFASITIGHFVKELYDANIQFLKLQKAVLFATDSFEDADKATDTFIGISQKLGLSIKDNIETYGRFVIAATASNLPLKTTNQIYESLGTALTVVGASAVQQQLAFYGLTEMLQKGVVYSKEFNRQIGAQLPGNAILGARALSQLEGRTVSVTEFFERMHKGMLLSSNFVPVWAAAVKKMYAPLLPLAQMRPDIAITRLANTFRMFAREVATGGMMTAIGSSIKGISDQFTYLDKNGVPQLTEHAKKLADALGKNLANIIRSVGAALKFLASHVDQLIFSLKALAAFSVTKKILDWGASAMTAAKSFEKLALSITAVNTAAGEGQASALGSWVKNARAMRATGAAGAASGVAGAAEAAWTGEGKQLEMMPLMRPTQGAFNFGEAAFQTGTGGLVASDETAVAAAALAARRGTPTSLLARAGGAVRGAGAAVGEGATKALSSVLPVIDAIGTAFSVVATAGTAVAVAMGAVGLALGVVLAVGAAISSVDSGMKTAAGHIVKYGDEESAALSDIWDQVKGVMGAMGDGLLDLSKSFLSLFGVTSSGGKIFAGLIAGLEALFGGLYAEISVPIRFVVATIKTIFDTLYDGAMMVVHALSGNMTAAGKDWGQLKGDVGNAWKQFAVGAGNDLSGADLNKHYDRIINGANAQADQRGQKDTHDTAAQRQIEAALRQQASASMIEQAAQTFAGAATGMDQIVENIDPDKLLARIKSFGAGNVNAGLNQTQISANGPGANLGLRNIIAGAAGQYGIDPQTLFNLGLSESHYDPKQYGWSGNGTSARGPFQMTTGALTDVHNQYPGLDTSPDAVLHLETSAKLAAAYLKIVTDTFQGKTGRALLPQEVMMPYKLGAGGAAKLANVIDSGQGDNTLAKNLFPDAAKAHGNQSLFWAKDPVTGQYNIPKTASDLYGSYVHMATPANAVTSGTSSDIAALQPGEGATGGPAANQSIDNVSDDAFKKFQAVIGEGSPAAAAAAQFQERMVDISKTLDKMQKNAAQFPWAKTFLGDPAIQQGIAHAFDELKKRQEEAMDPMRKMNRLQTDANSLQLLRIKGFNDEAEYQAKINELVEQGDIREAIDLKANHDRFLALQAETRAYESILSIQKELVGIDLKRGEILSKSPVQNALNAQLAGAALPGEASLDQVQKRLQSTQGGQAQLGAMQNFAQASVNFSSASAMHDIQNQTGVLASAYGLDSTQKDLQSNYRQFLQQITGLTTTDIASLESAAGDAASKFAKQEALLREQLENPPGFQKWVDGLEPFDKRLEDIKGDFMNGLSDGITADLTDGKFDWKSMFGGLQKEFVKANVDNMLKMGLSGLGLAQTDQATTPEGRSIQSASSSLQSVADGAMTTAATNLNTAAASLQAAAQSIAGAGSTAASGITTAAQGVANGPAPTLPDGLRGALGGGDDATATLAALPGTAPNLISAVQPSAAGTFGLLPSQINPGAGVGADIPALAQAAGIPAGALPGLSKITGALSAGMNAPPTMAQTLNPNQSGGMFSGIGNMFSGLFGGGNSASSFTPDMVDVTPNQATGLYSDGSAPSGGFLDSLGKMFGISGNSSTSNNMASGLLFGGLSLLSSLFGDTKSTPSYHMPDGIIGQMSTNTVTGTPQEGHANILGGVLTMLADTALSAASGAGGASGGAGGAGAAAGGSGLTSFIGNLFGPSDGGGMGSSSAGLLNFLGFANNSSGSTMAGSGSFLVNLLNTLGLSSQGTGLFAEGGLSTSPVSVMSQNDWRALPHYAQGTHNTSGFPAILHPNEAVIPLSKNRKIPLEGNMGGNVTNMSSNVTIVAKDMDSFRKSKSAIQRDQSRLMQRNAIRNLTNGSD